MSPYDQAMGCVPPSVRMNVMINLRPVNTDLLHLCQAQMAILAEQFGAAVSVVYLTEHLANGEAKLVPIAVYPDTVTPDRANPLNRRPLMLMPEQIVWSAETAFSLPQTSAAGTLTWDDDPHQKDTDWQGNRPKVAPETGEYVETDRHDAELLGDDRALPPEQLVLPLVYEGVVLGLLVTGRDDRPWSRREQAKLAPITETIAIACAWSQRYAWLQEQYHQQHQRLAQQKDITDTLLHQFRNPLTALRTFGKLLLRRLQPEDPNRTLAQSIVRESDRLQELAQQLDEAITIPVSSLRLAIGPAALPACATPDEPSTPQSLPQLAAAADTSPEFLPAASLTSTAPLVIEACDLEQILPPLLDSAQAIAQDRELRLGVNLPNPLPTVWANAIALREVISNLLDNALKYTPPGGQIWVSGEVRAHPDPAASQSPNALDIPPSHLRPSFCLTISDTGPGIPPADQAHLFERHYRGVQAQSAIPGTGLGLAIVRDLLTRMQGEIEIFSPALPPWNSLDTAALDNSVDPDHAPVDPSSPGTTAIVRLPIASDPNHVYQN